MTQTMRFSVPPHPHRLFLIALAASVASPAAAQYIGGNAPPLPAAPLPGVIESPSDSLARSIRILAASPRDFAALMAAGRAELELDDLSAAAGFFGRADEVRPSDPAPKVGMGGALVQTGDARGALDWFGQAQRLGASTALLGADRGLAHDLLGELAAAQADYRAALTGPMPDEARRRLALSLAIGGKMGEGLSALQPLLNRRDPAAQRVRAFVLALGGQRGAAIAAIDQSMPGASARIGPFFDVLPRLSTIQKAAAVHLGVFPTSAERAMASAVLPAPSYAAPPYAAPTASPTVSPPAPSRPRPMVTPELGSRRSAPLPSELANASPPPLGPPQGPPPAVAAKPARRFTTEDTPSLSVASIGHYSSRPKPVAVTVSAPPPVKTVPGPQPSFSPTIDLPTATADRLSGIDRILAATREPLEPVAGNTLPEPALDATPPTDRKAAARKSAAEKKAAAARQAAAEEKAAVKKAADKAAAAEQAAIAKRGVPGDHWVQLAGGTNVERMTHEFARIRAKKSALFAGHPGYVTGGKDYFRLLVGPFDDGEAARDYAAKLAKAGIDGFSWPRTPPQIRIEKLPSK